MSMITVLQIILCFVTTWSRSEGVALSVAIQWAGQILLSGCIISATTTVPQTLFATLDTRAQVCPQQSQVGGVDLEYCMIVQLALLVSSRTFSERRTVALVLLANTAAQQEHHLAPTAQPASIRLLSQATALPIVKIARLASFRSRALPSVKTARLASTRQWQAHPSASTVLRASTLLPMLPSASNAWQASTRRQARRPAPTALLEHTRMSMAAASSVLLSALPLLAAAL